MIMSHIQAKQPQRKTWPHEHLVHAHTLALRQAIDSSTWKNYGSALNSYLNFIRLHNLPVKPTIDTLSFYTIYMCHYIKPDSVNTYLSGICQQLEPFFENVRELRQSQLVHQTLQGCKQLHGSPVKRKRALTINDLTVVTQHLGSSTSHNDLLFTTILLVGFFALMRLGELTYPDDTKLQNPRKLSPRCSVRMHRGSFEFFLPGHKADRFFEGNTILLHENDLPCNPAKFFTRYLASRDRRFPFSPHIWMREDGSVPTRSFFITRLHHFFEHDMGGQSMRAGGATSLAENGAPPQLIQAIGRWASLSFQIYIRKHPVLLHAMLYAHPSYVVPQT